MRFQDPGVIVDIRRGESPQGHKSVQKNSHLKFSMNFPVLGPVAETWLPRQHNAGQSVFQYAHAPPSLDVLCTPREKLRNHAGKQMLLPSRHAFWILEDLWR